MTKAADPYYNRKPVPDELIKDVGLTGLSADEEFRNREKKFIAANGVDLRRFSNSLHGGVAPQSDPYYGRRRVSNQEITDVGATGLSPEEEYLNRERKFSVGGTDLRKFSRGTKSSLEPSSDPYYYRKKVSAAETHGVAPLDHLTPAEQYEVRERKQSLFQLSDDPFDVLANRGHRESISGAATAASAAASRRRSSATAPDATVAAAGHTHSGYDGGHKLQTIVSKAEAPTGSQNEESSASGHISEDRDSIDPVAGRNGEHTKHYDAVTTGHQHHDPDNVAPHEVR